jgi:cytoskeletal protein CcmA (bactofilin family)
MMTMITGKKPAEAEQVGGMLGEGVVLEGTLTFANTFRIDGEFKGKILRSDRLVIGEKGKVNGEIEVNALVVYGRLEGAVKVKGHVEVHPKGRIIGDVQMASTSLSVMEGGLIEGSIKMGQPDGAAASVPQIKAGKA